MTKKPKRVTISIVVRVNDAPPAAPIRVTVEDGQTLNIVQPVEAYFQPDGPPIPRIVR